MKRDRSDEDEDLITDIGSPTAPTAHVDSSPPAVPDVPAAPAAVHVDSSTPC